MTSSRAYIQLLAVEQTTYVLHLLSSNGLEPIGRPFRLEAMALLSGQQLSRVHPAELVVGFPACGAAEGKVDVLVEISGHWVRHRISKF